MSYIGPFPLPIVGGGTAHTTFPAFLAYASANLSNVTGDNTGYTVLFGSTSFDNTSSYNTGTGIYTAPSTGNYLFSVSLDFNGIASGHTTSQVTLVVSTGAQYFNSYSNPFAQSNTGQLVFNFSQVIGLTAAQTVKVVFQVGNSTKAITLLGQAIASGGLTTFGGYLLT